MLHNKGENFIAANPYYAALPRPADLHPNYEYDFMKSFQNYASMPQLPNFNGFQFNHHPAAINAANLSSFYQQTFPAFNTMPLVRPENSFHSENQDDDVGNQNSIDGKRKISIRESTATLKAWLYEHRANPYPTKGEKVMLAIITKMTLTQVSTWFANARRRLKKENKIRSKESSSSKSMNVKSAQSTSSSSNNSNNCQQNNSRSHTAHNNKRKYHDDDDNSEFNLTFESDNNHNTSANQQDENDNNDEHGKLKESLKRARNDNDEDSEDEEDNEEEDQSKYEGSRSSSICASADAHDKSNDINHEPAITSPDTKCKKRKSDECNSVEPQQQPQPEVEPQAKKKPKIWSIADL